MTETDLAYLAGLFDGEGCVGKSSSWQSGDARVSCYRISVSNSERRLCELFMVFGGSVCEVTHRQRAIRPQFQWKATGVAMERTHRLEPYLKVKRIPPKGTRYPDFEGVRQQWLALKFNGTVKSL